jgi:cysteine desulfurase/selenocysteine lyase
MPQGLLRHHFAHLNEGIYLNHASISPLSHPVRAQLDTFLDQRFIAPIENYFPFLPILQATRERLATLLHTTPDRMAFCANTSAGLNLLATGLNWKPGDRIVLNPLEFPANVYPFLNCQRLGVEIDWVQPRGHYLDLEDFAQLLTPRTRLVSISHVQFLTGQRIHIPTLAALCQTHGALLCVDGIQSLGATDLDVTQGVDFLACGSHKWMMGLEGMGFVYLSEALQAQLIPAFAGWLSVTDDWNMLDYQLHFKPDARRFETGTLNFPSITSLHASLGVFAEVGFPAITAHILALSEQLITGCQSLGLEVVTPFPASEHLGIVTLRHPEAEYLYQALLQTGIRASVREQQYLRFSPHLYNSSEEIAIALKALQLLVTP